MVAVAARGGKQMKKKYTYLSYEMRKALEKRYRRGERPCDIAKAIGVHTATVYNELARGYTGQEDENFRPGYSAEIGQRALQKHFKARGRRFVGRSDPRP